MKNHKCKDQLNYCDYITHGLKNFSDVALSKKYRLEEFNTKA